MYFLGGILMTTTQQSHEENSSVAVYVFYFWKGLDFYFKCNELGQLVEIDCVVMEKVLHIL